MEDKQGGFSEKASASHVSLKKFSIFAWILLVIGVLAATMWVISNGEDELVKGVDTELFGDYVDVVKKINMAHESIDVGDSEEKLLKILRGRIRVYVYRGFPIIEVRYETEWMYCYILGARTHGGDGRVISILGNPGVSSGRKVRIINPPFIIDEQFLLSTIDKMAGAGSLYPSNLNKLKSHYTVQEVLTPSELARLRQTVRVPLTEKDG